MTYQLADPADLLKIVRQQKQNISVGIASVCSAHTQVLEACLRQRQQDNGLLLVESTCNQVNQFGGYTGLTPSAFVKKIVDLAENFQFPPERLLLGGDHLGPYPWRKESSAGALDKSIRLVEDYVAAGFRKIHLDTSMPCGDDPAEDVPKTLSASRAALLCAVCERTASLYPQLPKPIYVIGSEVPAPGGAAISEQVTSPEDAQETLEIYQHEFMRKGLHEAWERVAALVVHPGVEFGDDHINLYNRDQTRDLARFIRQVPGIVFEAHSTDYQPPHLLRQMVEDQFAILKVGPALTFTFRQALFALENLEQEWLGWREEVELSQLRQTVLNAMHQDQRYWADYYHGSPGETVIKQLFSYSDRIRYYWSEMNVHMAIERLLANLRRFPPPLPLISQYMPRQYARLQDETVTPNPQEWIWNEIQESWRSYTAACQEG